MKKIPSLIAALCVAAIISGCGKSEAPTSGGGTPAVGKKLKLSFVSNNAANFWSFARAGCNAAANELGDVDVDFRITQDGSSCYVCHDAADNFGGHPTFWDCYGTEVTVKAALLTYLADT